jgi:iron complex outermembrane receptor protein
LRWHPRADLDVFVQGDAVGRVHADDANTAWAPGHATLDIGIEHRWVLGALAVQGFARVDNLLDRRSIGSVIVNDSNGRYFEPAPGRGWTLAVTFGRAQSGP